EASRKSDPFTELRISLILELKCLKMFNVGNGSQKQESILIWIVPVSLPLEDRRRLCSQGSLWYN
ncbi:hypothetical protein OS493_013248, partial [Desmophyllum pertusum]